MSQRLAAHRWRPEPSPQATALTGGAAGSADTTNSLRSYVPEVVWNEDSPSHGIVAGGGGSSVHFPRPAWQSAYSGMPVGTNRLLPDIALQSSIASPGSACESARAHRADATFRTLVSVLCRTARPELNGAAQRYRCIRMRLDLRMPCGLAAQMAPNVVAGGPIPFTRRPNLIGCGGGANNSTSPPPTTHSATTYTVTLSGTDSVNNAITASTTFTLTVD